MTGKIVQLEEALSLALSLSPLDRLKLVERIVSSVESDMSTGQQSATSAPVGTWGAEVVALLNQLDLTEWEQMDIPDVGNWVHQLRHQESGRFNQHWTGEE